MPTPARILVIDESPVFRGVVRDLLEARGFEVAGEAGCLQSAEAALESQALDGVLVDLRLGTDQGEDVASHIRRFQPGLSVVLTSAGVVEDQDALLHRTGARGFVRKDALARVDLTLFWPDSPSSGPVA